MKYRLNTKKKFKTVNKIFGTKTEIKQNREEEENFDNTFCVIFGDYYKHFTS